MRRSLPNGNAPARTKRGAPDSPTKNGATAIRSRSTRFPVKNSVISRLPPSRKRERIPIVSKTPTISSAVTGTPTRTTVATRPSRSSFSPGASPAAITTLSPAPVEKKRDSESRSPPMPQGRIFQQQRRIVAADGLRPDHNGITTGS